MKPTAIHLHLHYVNMWPKIREYLQHMGSHPYHLYVTLTQENALLFENIKRFHPQSTIWCTENRGYDIGPFVDFLHKVDLSQYDLVLKIHTKSKSFLRKTCINGRYITKKRWGQLLFDALLGTDNVWQHNLAVFTQQPQLGMLASRYLITGEPGCSEHLRDEIMQIMHKMGYQIPKQITFVAGTMFLVRAELLQEIKKHFTINDFSITDTSIQDGTRAHAFERVFGCLVIAQGYEVKGFDNNRGFENIAKFQRLLDPFYSNDITSHHHHIIKVCKIPVYYKNLNKNKRG